MMSINCTHAPHINNDDDDDDDNNNNNNNNRHLYTATYRKTRTAGVYKLKWRIEYPDSLLRLWRYITHLLTYLLQKSLKLKYTRTTSRKRNRIKSPPSISLVYLRNTNI